MGNYPTKCYDLCCSIWNSDMFGPALATINFTMFTLEYGTRFQTQNYVKKEELSIKLFLTMVLWHFDRFSNFSRKNLNVALCMFGPPAIAFALGYLGPKSLLDNSKEKNSNDSKGKTNTSSNDSSETTKSTSETSTGSYEDIEIDVESDTVEDVID